MKFSSLRLENTAHLSIGETEMLCSIFHEKLDPHSGSVQDTQSEGNGYWQTVFDALWKGNIHFIVVESPNRRDFGHYYVMRDNQYISPSYTFTETDASLFRLMQGMIDDIESGNEIRRLWNIGRGYGENDSLLQRCNWFRDKRRISKIDIEKSILTEVDYVFRRT